MKQTKRPSSGEGGDRTTGWPLCGVLYDRMKPIRKCSVALKLKCSLQEDVHRMLPVMF